MSIFFFIIKNKFCKLFGFEFLHVFFLYICSYKKESNFLCTQYFIDLRLFATHKWWTTLRSQILDLISIIQILQCNFDTLNENEIFLNYNDESYILLTHESLVFNICKKLRSPKEETNCFLVPFFHTNCSISYLS